MKEAYHNGREPNLTFWRDKTGNEVDLLVTEGNIQKAYELKSGETYNTDYFKGIDYWAKLSGAKPENCFVRYAGNRTLKTSKGDVVSWFDW